MAVEGTALAELAQELAESADHEQTRMAVASSARNRFSGLISRVTRDSVMAQVEIQAGPHRFVSLLSREAADELGLEPGMLAVAAVKATNVSVEIPKSELNSVSWPVRDPGGRGRTDPGTRLRPGTICERYRSLASGCPDRRGGK